jgi:hypothetical protein
MARLHSENILHGVQLELVKVPVDARGQQGLELVCAGFDLPLGGFFWRRRIFSSCRLRLRIPFSGFGLRLGLGLLVGEAEVLRGDGEEETFDRVESAVGEDVDCVDDVV